MTGGTSRSAPGEPPPPDEMHVLSIVHSAAYGGPHNQAVQLHRVLDKHGPLEGGGALEGEGGHPGDGAVRLTVVMPDEPGDAPDRLRAAGVPVVQMRLVRPRASRREQGLLALVTGYPGQILRLRRLMKETAVDVVEVHGLLNVDGAVAARLAGRGVVWQLIDTRPPRSLRWLMMPLVLLLADVIMTTGRAVAAEYPGARLRPARLMPFVPPVGPLSGGARWGEDVRRGTREVLAVPDEAVLVASVGNLNPQKGYEALIDAVAECRRRQMPADLQLRVRGAVQTGHESYAEGLRSRAEDRGLPPETVGGFEPGLGPGQLMCSSDIFALASRPRSEGMPTVILEAMSVGLPVVATAVGSIPEIVGNGVSGVLVGPDDPAQLARALERLADDPQERERLGLAGRAVVEHQASPESFARRQMRAYRLSAGRHRRRRSP